MAEERKEIAPPPLLLILLYRRGGREGVPKKKGGNDYGGWAAPYTSRRTERTWEGASENKRITRLVYLRTTNVSAALI